MDFKHFSQVLKSFGVCVTEASQVAPFGNGHINETYLVQADKKYVLQKINTHIFKDPEGLMQNVVAVCRHIEKSLAKAGDTVEQAVRMIPTLDGKNYLKDEQGECYRLMDCINGFSHDEKPTTALLEAAAAAFGRFQKNLADFPAAELNETIPLFHDTRRRVENLHKAIDADVAGRAASVQNEIAQAVHFEPVAGTIADGLDRGEIPLRVTHNDTKLNNLLFNEAGQCVAVIDLDTVMPGSMLYDFGDALRFGGSSAAEDETDLSQVRFLPEAYEAFAKGFLGALGDTVTPREKELLPLSVLLMTYECGIRFLTDYLEGDVYFRIHHPGHNLERARNQLALAADIERQLPLLAEITARY